MIPLERMGAPPGDDLPWWVVLGILAAAVTAVLIAAAPLVP
jgi:hypothetical protein